MNKNFALIGAAGYIAPTHMRAIIETGNYLRCAYDINDSVGIMDQYSRDVNFFTEFEFFNRHIEGYNHNNKIDYMTICSPNNMHDSHVIFALNIGTNVICEKPLVLNYWELDRLESAESKTGKHIYNVLQLRIHPVIKALKSKIEKSKKRHRVILTYITSRGKWYDNSWKGSEKNSGGIPMNIGIHLFDLLIWIFGKVQSQEVYLRTNRKASGFIELENADVSWYLSIDEKDLPKKKDFIANKYRSIIVNKDVSIFNNNFNLHTELYKEIFKGNGIRIKDIRPSIKLVNNISYDKIKKYDIYTAHPILLKDKIL